MVAAVRPRRLSRADLHLHTTCSDGLDSPEALMQHLALRGGLQVVAVTDHDSVAGGLRARERAARLWRAPEVIVGTEVSSRDGHILGLFVEHDIPAGLSAAATVDLIHAQGGLAIAAHPFWRSRGGARRLPQGVGRLALATDFDGIEILNGAPHPTIWASNRLARRMLPMGTAATGGSDGHIKQAAGSAVTLFRGSTAADLRTAILSAATSVGRSRPELASGPRYLAWTVRHDRVGTLHRTAPQAE